MKSKIKLLNCISIIVINCYIQFATAQTQPFSIEWQKEYGGSAVEYNDYMGNTIAATQDGGYVFTAMTYSNDGDVSGYHGGNGTDMWVAKIDATGNLQWQKCLGGSADDFGKNIIATADGGVLVGGYTESNDGDISGNHGNGDIDIFKLDGAGNIEWEKTLGSSSYDDLGTFIQDQYGNYVIAGTVGANDGDVSGGHGGADAWVVKLDQNGNIIWQKCYGGSSGENDYHLTSIIQSLEGGYMLSTYTESDDGEVTGYHGTVNDGYGDAWLVKLDIDGNIQWEKAFGGPGYDGFENIMQLSSGDYIGAGLTTMAGGDIPHVYGFDGITDTYDWWIAKISTAGNLIWSRTYGGTGDEAIHNAAFEQANGDLIITSGTRSVDYDCIGSTIDSINPTDLWMVKMDSDGNISGSNFFGGIGYQNLSAAVMNRNGSLTIAGMTDSTNYTGEGFNQDNDSNAQVWVVKLSPVSVTSVVANASPLSLTIYPNPFSQSTIISFSLLQSQNVSLKIYDVTGRLVTTLANEIMTAGTHQLPWDATDESGNALSAGIYLFRVKTADQAKTIRVSVI
ncbi:MAG: T9SS type A sorting domain-containing protein [Chitinophagales bacterium]|nr:T9SS type A sorting domain-containing protein [Chitinophagales bacterium]